MYHVSVHIWSNIWLIVEILRQEEHAGNFFHALLFFSVESVIIVGVAAATLHLDSLNSLIILGTETALSSILVSFGWALVWYHTQFLEFTAF